MGSVEKVKAAAERDAGAKAAVPLVAEFNKSLKKSRDEIERRFVYYSRLATIGTLAQMLVHEVRNKTTVVASVLDSVAQSEVASQFSEKLRERLDRAKHAVTGLDALAQTFLPLASRSFGRGRRSSILEDRIAGALALKEVELRHSGIEVRFRRKADTKLAVDPGELDAVILNLIDNAIYWLGRIDKAKRVLEINIAPVRGADRIRVAIHDSGPGIPEEDAEKVFWPGVTRKPGGIGMGLTIASEIVDAYDGKMRLALEGELGGASFEFDLPLSTK